MDASPVYLDYNATTPVDPAVREAMLPYLGEHFGNPSSSHPYGRRAREAVEAARAEVAASVGSACHSEGDAVSGVLAAMGLGPERARGAVRLSVGLMTTEEEITRAAGALVAAWRAAHG